MLLATYSKTTETSCYKWLARIVAAIVGHTKRSTYYSLLAFAAHERRIRCYEVLAG